MFDGSHMGGGYYSGGFMLIWWILIILAIVGLVKWIAGQSAGPGSDNQSGKSPREILDERYARGEIDHEEYAQKKKDLED